LRTPPSGEPAVPEVVAYHLTEANAFCDAAAEWLEAGRQAARRSAHVEAITHLRKGLEVLQEMPASDLRDKLELGIQAALIGSLSATDGPTSPIFNACCERGLALCKSTGQSPLILPFIFGQFTYAMCRGELQPARSAAETFLRLATTAGSMPATVVGHRLLGMVQFGQGFTLDAKEHLTTSLRLYQHDRDEATTHIFGQNTQVHSRSLLSLVLFCLGSIEESIKTGINALESADHLLHPHSTALAQGYVGGWVFGLAGAKQALAESAQKLIALAASHHLGPFRLIGSAFSGWALCQDGRLGEGTEVMSEAVESLESIEFRLSLPAHLGNLAYFLLKSGKPEAARARCSQAIELIQKGADRWYEPELHRIDACIAKELDPSNLPAIEAKCRRSITCARALHFTSFQYSALKTSRQLLGDKPDIELDLRSMSEFGARYEAASNLVRELWQN
jgi:predicted ATPase